MKPTKETTLKLNFLSKITSFCFYLFLLILLISFSFLNCDKEKKINFSPEKYTNANKSNLRSDPLNIAPIVEILDRNTPVSIISKSNERVKLGAFNEYWYKVTLSNGVKGWLYGSALSNYMTLKKTDNKLSEEKQKENRMNRSNEQNKLYEQQVLLNQRLLTGTLGGAKNLEISSLKSKLTLKVNSIKDTSKENPNLETENIPE